MPAFERHAFADALEIDVEDSSELPPEPSGALALLRLELDAEKERSQADELEVFEFVNHAILPPERWAAEPMFDFDEDAVLPADPMFAGEHEQDLLDDEDDDILLLADEDEHGDGHAHAPEALAETDDADDLDPLAVLEREAERHGATLIDLGEIEAEADPEATAVNARIELPEADIALADTAADLVQAEDDDDDSSADALGLDGAEASTAELPSFEHEVDPDPLSVPLWSPLNTLRYAFLRGLRGMGQSPLVQLLAISTTAVCMLLLGTACLIFQNARTVAQTMGVDVPVTVFMAPETDPATTEALAALLEDLPEVEQAERVTPAQALARLEQGLGEGLATADADEGLLAGIDPASLPDTIELDLAADVDPDFADALALRVQDMDGVDEVTVLGPWVQQVEDMLKTLRWLAVGVGLLVSLACLAIVWSTIRLGVFARRSELQILRLVGGTDRFVRAPFVVEGVLQGLLGTALALAGLWLAFDLIRPFLERGLALVFAAGSIHFFSLVELGLALGFGALLGLVGARAAVARHVEA